MDDDGNPHAIDSADVNDYIREISGDDFSAKDFRTWVGTVTCAMLLADQEIAETQTERKQQLTSVIKDVAHRLGNTPAVCRKCYVHPHVMEHFMEGERVDLQRKMQDAQGLLTEELLVLALLQERAKESDSSRTMKQLQRSIRSRKKKAA